MSLILGLRNRHMGPTLHTGQRMLKLFHQTFATDTRARSAHLATMCQTCRICTTGRVAKSYTILVYSRHRIVKCILVTRLTFWRRKVLGSFFPDQRDTITDGQDNLHQIRVLRNPVIEIPDVIAKVPPLWLSIVLSWQIGQSIV